MPDSQKQINQDQQPPDIEDQASARRKALLAVVGFMVLIALGAIVGKLLADIK
jgi:hypothetical protein